MAKIPAKPVLDLLKKTAPPAAKFLKENWGSVAALAPSAIQEINKLHTNNKEKNKIKMHHRKNQHNRYKKELLPRLNIMKRKELISAKLEIEQYIQQINNESQNESKVKNVVHSKRSKNWNEILIQVIDKMKSRDYEEYLLIFNNPSYKSIYFEDYDFIIDHFKNLISTSNIEELSNFITSHTGKNNNEVQKDFYFTTLS